MKNKIKLPKGWELKKLEDGIYEVIQKTESLEIGKDYIHNDGDLLIINRSGDEGNLGFLGNGSFFGCDMLCPTPEAWREATKEQVIEFFAKHLIERYGEDWKNVKVNECMYQDDEYTNEGLNSVDIDKYRDSDSWMVWNNNGCLFNGKEWAEVLEEPKYAKKLEDIYRPFYMENDGEVDEWHFTGQDVNHFATKQRAEQVLALIQLIAFRDDIWAKGGYGNYGIKTSFFGLVPQEGLHGMFSFKDKETCGYFIEKHRDLLEIYSGIFRK